MRKWSARLMQTLGRSRSRFRDRRFVGEPVSHRALRLAAEVLEPRCLLTNVAGFEVNDGVEVLEVAASKWTNVGLTVRVADGWVHVVRTGTQVDVIEPYAVDANCSLVIHGRANANDTLTIEAPNWPDLSLLAQTLHFDGSGGTDTIRLTGEMQNGLDFHVSQTLTGTSWLTVYDWSNYHNYLFLSAAHRDVEVIDSDWTIGSAQLNFDDSDNQVTIDLQEPQTKSVITDSSRGTTWRLKTPWLSMDLAGGDDSLTLRARETSSDVAVAQVFCSGSMGDDTLRGSDRGDQLSGGHGNDWLLGLGGDDQLDGGEGNDLLEGGEGLDFVSVPESGNLLLGETTFAGTTSGTDTIRGVEQAVVYGDWYGPRHRFEVSGFQGQVTLHGSSGDDTLIGGSNHDQLNGREGNDVLIGRDGDDQLSGGYESLLDHDVLLGGPGNDSLYGGYGQDTCAGGDGLSADESMAQADEGDYFSNCEIVFESYDASLAWLATGLGVIDVAPNPDFIIVPPTAWNDGGLTVTLLDGLVHVFRTGTQADVVDPFPASPYTELRIIGREQESDVLTIDLNNPNRTNRDSWWLSPARVNLFGGRGFGIDIVNVINDPSQLLWFPNPLRSSDIDVYQVGQVHDVELVNRQLGEVSYLILDDKDNDVTVEMPTADRLTIVTLLDAPTTFRFECQSLNEFWAMGGNDRVTVLQSWSDPLNTTQSVTIKGNAGDDTLIGQAGNDNLFGEEGNDWLIGGDGNDALDGSSGNDTVLAGAGHDRVSAGSGSDSVDGGDGNDALDDSEGWWYSSGTEIDSNTMLGGTGDDQLSGGQGVDYFFGGTGNDWINGGEGANHLDGGDGNDNLWAGEGNDLIDGGVGNDVLYGGNGRNTLLGQAGKDEIWGGSGDDLIDGGSGRDRLFADAGNDTLRGGAGNDLLIGAIGDDSLDGGRGTDMLIGSNGPISWLGGEPGLVEPGDRFANGEFHDESYQSLDWDYIGPHDEYDSAQTLFIDASKWTDAGLTVRSITLATGEVLMQIVRTDTGEEVVPAINFSASDVELVQFNGRDHAPDVLTIEVDQWVGFNNNLPLRFDGGAGEGDEIRLTGGDAWSTDIHSEKAGSGFISLYYGWRRPIDYLRVETISDLSTTYYQTVIFGPEHNRVTVEPVDGRVVLTDATTKARIVLHSTPEFSLSAGAGNDSVTLRPGLSELLTSYVSVSGDEGNDTLKASDRAVRFFGGEGNDQLIGSNLGDELNGEFGDDTLLGLGGDDTVYDGPGNDALAGGDGNDYLQDDSGTNTLLGQAGDDLLFSGEGDDALNGGPGCDWLYDWYGTNTLFGGEGIDMLNAYDGDDQLILDWDGLDQVQSGPENDRWIVTWILNNSTESLGDFDAEHDTLLTGEDAQAWFDRPNIRQLLQEDFAWLTIPVSPIAESIEITDRDNDDITDEVLDFEAPSEAADHDSAQRRTLVVSPQADDADLRDSPRESATADVVESTLAVDDYPVQNTKAAETPDNLNQVFGDARIVAELLVL